MLQVNLLAPSRMGTRIMEGAPARWEPIRLAAQQLRTGLTQGATLPELRSLAFPFVDTYQQHTIVVAGHRPFEVEWQFLTTFARGGIRTKTALPLFLQHVEVKNRQVRSAQPQVSHLPPSAWHGDVLGTKQIGTFMAIQCYCARCPFDALPRNDITVLNEALEVQLREFDGRLVGRWNGLTLALFNPPSLPRKDHAARAVSASWAMRGFLEKWNAGRKDTKQPTFIMRGGIHTGAFLSGILGSPAPHRGQIFRTHLNMAFHLEKLAPKGGVLLSQQTLVAFVGDFVIRRAGRTEVDGTLLRYWKVMGPTDDQQFQQSGTVVRVVDGDTFEIVIDGERRMVRLYGVDSPEHDQPFGAEAKAFLTQLIEGQALQIRERDTDRYGRIIMEAQRADGSPISHAMVESGWAWLYHNLQWPEVDLLQRQAYADHRGLWANPYPIPPWLWRKLRPEEKRQPPDKLAEYAQRPDVSAREDLAEDPT